MRTPSFVRVTAVGALFAMLCPMAAHAVDAAPAPPLHVAPPGIEEVPIDAPAPDARPIVAAQPLHRLD